MKEEKKLYSHRLSLNYYFSFMLKDTTKIVCIIMFIFSQKLQIFRFSGSFNFQVLLLIQLLSLGSRSPWFQWDAKIVNLNIVLLSSFIALRALTTINTSCENDWNGKINLLSKTDPKASSFLYVRSWSLLRFTGTDWTYFWV